MLLLSNLLQRDWRICEMATIYRCDRCHDDQTKPLKVIRIPRFWMDDYDSNDDIQREVCDNCLKLVDEFTKPIAKVALKQ